MNINVPAVSCSFGVPVLRESPLKKLASTEVEVNTSSTTAIDVTEINLGSEAYTKDKIIWVHVRDKLHKSAAFYGTDCFFINFQAASNRTDELSVSAIEILRDMGGGRYYGASLGSSYYGVYGASIDKDGKLKIKARYTSSYSTAINSTDTIDVYSLDPPVNLFD